MRISKLFGKTKREVPADADTVSHQLLLKAGMIHQVAAGIYSYMPLGWRVLKKIENIIREEMDKAGGQELMMSVLQPVELWQETGRDESFGKGLFTLTDRKDRTLVLAPTHEEVITQMVSRNVQSYHDLPMLLYQIQTKFRDEPRPKGGLVRVREFPMKDLYSFDIDEEGLNNSYKKMVQAYQNIYQRCGLPSLLVEADSGAIGGKDSHEFIVVTETGEDTVICCPNCGYLANSEKAESIRDKLPDEKMLRLEEVATPGMTSIDEVSGFLKVPRSRTLKAVFYVADGELVFVVVRGDVEVNEVKLKNVLHCSGLRMATETELIAACIVAGSASPVGLSGIEIVADESITSGTNFVAGANKADTHFRNVNYPRDFKADIIADIATAHVGDRCVRCGAILSSMSGIEVGHVFKLGTTFSERLDALYVDEEGVSRPIVMGCYGIGIGRLMAAAVEKSHDEKGIIWPLPIAPYQVYLCPLYRENAQIETMVENFYTELRNDGFEVLFDDRKQSPGVKFNDADLLGIPIRITISRRTLDKESVELKLRFSKETSLVPLTKIKTVLKELISQGLET